MTCRRCGGLTIAETWYDALDSFEGSRCLACGDISDPLILAHRAGVRPAPFKADIGCFAPVPIRCK